jgi:hypothetical protein
MVFDQLDQLNINELKKIEYVKAAEGHPLETGINNARIPIYPPTADTEKKPDLLWWQLETTKLSEVTDHLLKTIEANLVSVMIGVSGCGKTRSIYEYLASHWGLLFIADLRGNGGWRDLTDLIQRAETIGQGIRTSVALRNGVNHQWSCLLLARVWTLQWFRKKFGDAFRPIDWLWLQVYPKQICGHELDISERLVRRHMTFISCTQMEDEMTKELGDEKIACFVDEAQVMIDVAPYFPPYMNHGDTPNRDLVHASMVFFRLIRKFNVVFTGTGMRLTKWLKTSAASAVQKDNKKIEPRVFFKHVLGWTATERFLQGTTGMAQDDLAKLRPELEPWVSSRGRFAANFAKLLITRAFQMETSDINLNEAKSLARAAVREYVQRTVEFSENDVLSMQDQLGKAINHMNNAAHDKLTNEIAEWIIRYRVGKPSRLIDTASDQLAAELFQNGLCRVSQNAKENLAVVALDEPLALEVMMAWLEREEADKRKSSNFYYSLGLEIIAKKAARETVPSNVGGHFEDAVILMLPAMFTKMASEGVSSMFDNNIAPATEKTSLRLWLPPAVRVLQRHHDARMTLIGRALIGATTCTTSNNRVEQLADLQTAFLRTSELNEPSPDVVCFANELGEDPAERTWIVLIQIKHRRENNHPWPSITVGPNNRLKPADIHRLGVKKVLQMVISWAPVKVPKLAEKKSARNAEDVKFEVFQAAAKERELQDLIGDNFSSAFVKQKRTAEKTERAKGKEPARH